MSQIARRERRPWTSAALLALLLVFPVTVRPSLAKTRSATHLDRDEELTRRRSLSDLFRNAFYTWAAGKYTAEQVSSIVYSPTDSLLLAPVSLPHGDPMPSLAKLTREILPHELHDLGKKSPPKSIPGLKEALRANPVTFISFPGMVSEFAATRPYEGALARTGSSAAVAWKKAIADHGDESAKSDEVYELDRLASHKVPIDKVVQVASIDDTDGSPLVRIVYLNPLWGSLETVAPMSESREIYLRRISKYFSICRIPSRVYFIGYSRGATVALDVLCAACVQDTRYAWAHSVGGVVSVAGTINGSKVSDDHISPPPGSKSIMPRLVELVLSTKVLTKKMSLTERTQVIAQNTAKLTEAANLMRETKGPVDPGYACENNKAKWPDMPASWSMVKGVLTKLFHTSHGAVFTEYSANITRLQVLVRRIQECLVDMTTERRMRWFQENEIPPDKKIVSLVATMWDASEPGKPLSDQLKNGLAMNPQTADYTRHRNTFYKLFRGSGIQFNDGTVIANEAICSTPVSLACNASQKPFQSILLGVVSSHHWSVVLPCGIKAQGVAVNSPFPHDLLLLAFASCLE